MRIRLVLVLVGILIFARAALLAQVTSDPTANRLGIVDRLGAMTQDDVKNLSSRAQKGDAEAEYWLGMLYASGKLVSKDKARSDDLLLRSAEKGYAPAELLVGMMAHPGDPPKVEKWMLAAAQDGNPEAQMWLGTAYEQRWFGTTDLQQAETWYRKAAEQGQPDAQVMLGQMYEYGEGVEQDYVAATGWYRKAAEHVPDLGGAGQGRNNLGLLYLQGRGVPKDYVRAYLWFAVGRSEGNLQEVQALMTPAQIEEAERMASDWKARHPQTLSPAE